MSGPGRPPFQVGSPQSSFHTSTPARPQQHGDSLDMSGVLANEWASLMMHNQPGRRSEGSPALQPHGAGQATVTSSNPFIAVINTVGPTAKPQCPLCERVNTRWMVQCAVCYMRFHYSCVGVNHTVRFTPWRCDGCEGTTRRLSRGRDPPSSSTDRRYRGVREMTHDINRLESRLQMLNEQMVDVQKANENRRVSTTERDMNGNDSSSDFRGFASTEESHSSQSGCTQVEAIIHQNRGKTNENYRSTSPAEKTNLSYPISRKPNQDDYDRIQPLDHSNNETISHPHPTLSRRVGTDSNATTSSESEISWSDESSNLSIISRTRQKGLTKPTMRQQYGYHSPSSHSFRPNLEARPPARSFGPTPLRMPFYHTFRNYYHNNQLASAFTPAHTRGFVNPQRNPNPWYQQQDEGLPWRAPIAVQPQVHLNPMFPEMAHRIRPTFLSHSNSHYGPYPGYYANQPVEYQQTRPGGRKSSYEDLRVEDPNVGRNVEDPNVGHDVNNDSIRHKTPTSNHDRSLENSIYLLASKLVPKADLPTFSGNPTEWPLFINSYRRDCEKLSDTENLQRLTRCLKGAAYEAVKGKLVRPESIRKAIDSLEKLFGRPEIIMTQLMKRIREFPAIKSERLDSIIKFSIEVENLCVTIEASQINEYLDNPTLRQEIIEKLPPNMKLEWGMYVRELPSVNLSLLSDWLTSMADAASLVTPIDISLFKPECEETTKKGPKRFGPGHTIAVHEAINQSSPKRVPARQDKPAERIGPSSSNSKEEKCRICDMGTHPVKACEKFLAMSKNQRWESVIRAKLCYACLGRHFVLRCKQRKQCGVDGCVKKHDRLLHNPNPRQRGENLNSNGTTAKTWDTKNEVTEPRGHHHHHAIPSSLYRIIPVTLYGKTSQIQTLAFLDDGSSVSLIEEEIADELQLEGPAQELCLKWSGDVSRIENDSRVVSFDISGVESSCKKYRLNMVNTVKKLELPEQTVSMKKDIRSYKHLENLPIPTYLPGRPTILIGLDNYKLTVPLELRESTLDAPIATKTRLGWLICGPRKNVQGINFINHHHKCECECDRNIQEAVKYFFSLENFGTGLTKVIQSEADSQALELLKSTTVYSKGRYETGLLWRDDIGEIPNSRPMAIRRLLCFERKLERDIALKENINNQIKEYIKKGYARKLMPSELTPSSRTWYLPIFAIRNPNKPAKVRLVWDAASKACGKSLNDFLHKGPDQMSLLPEVLYRFRERGIAVTGDIQEMFHQVKIRKCDQDSQRFLWRDVDPSREPDEYIMMVMTFGSTCSPCSAQFVKNTNADRFTEFPRAVRAIKENHYVDDYLDSFNTVEEAAQVANEVKVIHAEGGFNIRNWLSNSQTVLKSLGVEFTEDNSNKSLTAIDTPVDRVLGMWWNTVDDNFIYSINRTRMKVEILDGTRPPTKREALSTVMSLFDPLGLISPFLTMGKMVIQDLWRKGTEWDEEIGPVEYGKWREWTQRLFLVENLRIPRAYTSTALMMEELQHELHVFVDAGEEAYAAAVYIRSTHPDKVTCRLVSAKSRVAPRKPLSIPRLELLAAVAGVRLASVIMKSHTIHFSSRTFWSDSTTVLSWLNSDARRYKQFVALRVSECLENSELSEWRYVPSTLNAADEATKVYKGGEPLSERWLEGPSFLLKTSTDWPTNPMINEKDSCEPELRTQLFHGVMSLVEPVAPTPAHFEKWNILIRATAIMLRARDNFLQPLRKTQKRMGPIITTEEYQQSKNILFRKAQWDVYKEEISQLTIDRSSVLEKSSQLFKLSPFIDATGVLRMKGRIDKAYGISEDMKNPVILPTYHPVTMLFVRNFHEKYKHQYHETVLNEVRQRTFIPKLRVLLRRIRSKCSRCKIRTAAPEPPMMSELPKSRVSILLRAFSFTGLDYFGPMEVCVGRRVEKRWGALFTCMSTRAIHIEVAHSLSTDSAIQCLKRFIARRGVPREITSDNGTNFRGASSELRERIKEIKKERIVEQYPEIVWKFNPPGAPHFGGSWERLVRSVKSVLHEILPTRRPKDELLRTTLTEIEGIVNSRPLTYVPLETSDMEALTPNHFLVGSSSGQKPLAISTDDGRVLLRSWQQAENISRQFWKRWISEYLPTITRRTKWFNPVKPLEIGDVVIIVESKNPTNTWPRGIVEDVTRSPDGQVRSAIVRTASGVYTRPAVKLAKLDIIEKVKQSTSETVNGVEKCCQQRPK